MKKTSKSERGQGLIEYLLLVCLIAATTIGIVSVVGQNIKEQFKKASATIRGADADSIGFTKPDDNQTKARGMDDWESGAKKSK